MFTVELKFKIADREVPLDRFVETLANRGSDRVIRERRRESLHEPASEAGVAAQPKAVAVNKAAELIGVSPRTIWYYIQTGTLKVTRIGRRVLISSQTLEKIAREGLPRLTQKRQPGL